MSKEGKPIIVSPEGPYLEDGVKTQEYEAPFAAEPEGVDYTWEIIYQTRGLDFNFEGNLLKGKPETSGVCSVWVKAMASNENASDPKGYLLNIQAKGNCQITDPPPPDLPGGIVGQPYSVYFQQSGCDTQIQWSSSTPPPGLAMATVNGKGHLNGTPTQGGSFQITVKVTCKGGSSNKTYNLFIKG